MFNLNNYKIATRLTFSYGAVILLLLVTGILGLANIRMLTNDMHIMGNERVPGLRTMSELNFERMVIRAQTLYLFQIRNHDNRAEKIGEILRERETSWENAREAMDQILAIRRATETGRQLVANLEQNFEQWRSIHMDLESIMSQIASATGSADLDRLYTEYEQIATNMIPVSEALAANLTNLINQNSSVTTRMVSENEATAQNVFFITIIVMIIAMLLSAFLAFLINRSVVSPLNQTVEYSKKISKGDFSENLPHSILNLKDETGDLGRAFQSMVESTRGILIGVVGGIESVASSASQLSAISTQTSQSVQQISERSSAVAAAAQETNSNTLSLATGMQQASANLGSVATATEEMSATIGKIASSSEKARAISNDAASRASTVSELMQRLDRSAQEIGQVTDTIIDISSQTNLLALNATIEAARAGAAGKGFAVVANEIKELARQTASATEDIRGKIEGVQLSASDAIADIQSITDVIAEVGELVNSIATAIEKQSVVTRDVASNISQASIGVQDANERVSHTVSLTSATTEDIHQFNATAGELRTSGEQVEMSAHELNLLTEQLKAMVSKFRFALA